MIETAITKASLGNFAHIHADPSRLAQLSTSALTADEPRAKRQWSINGSAEGVRRKMPREAA
jgi:hypothetical protein